MLLQKAGWHIKHLISHSKYNSRGDPGDSRSDERFVDSKRFVGNSKRASWLSQASAGEVSSLRTAISSATTRNRGLSPASATAHTSASSLCSCDCEATWASTNHSLFVPEPATTLPDILCTPPLTSTNSSPNSKTWRFTFLENLSRSPPADCVNPDGQGESSTSFDSEAIMTARASTVDLLEALAIGPVDQNRTPTQSIQETQEVDMEELSGSVEQLIRETDEAFRAVGSALADAKAVTGEWHIISTPTSGPKPVTRPTATPAPLKIQNSRSTPMLKGKRRKSIKKKTTFLGRALRKVPPTPTNTPPRWTLSDMTTNMADVFSGKMFRTEV